MHVPNLDKLNASVPPDLDVNNVAADWMASFSSYVQNGDVEGIVGLFIGESLERHASPHLALTWDFRTFHGVPAIRKFLADRLVPAKLSAFRVKEQLAALQRPYPDIA